MSFRPFDDRFVVERLEQEEKTKDGIIIPDTAEERPQEAEMVAVGERSTRPTSIGVTTRRIGTSPISSRPASSIRQDLPAWPDRMPPRLSGC
jgi:hypothetical protein